jgi:hypothetical protein
LTHFDPEGKSYHIHSPIFTNYSKTTDFVGKKAYIPILTKSGIQTIETNHRTGTRIRGQDAYAYRLGVEEMTREVESIWPSTRAVDQPWFKEWTARHDPPSKTVAEFDRLLKDAYLDLREQMNRQSLLLSLDTSSYGGIDSEASPYWKASRIPRWKMLMQSLKNKVSGKLRGGSEDD